MTDHERAIVKMFNNFFQDSNNNLKGVAHRKKQHRFTSQLCDVLVDSPHKEFYLAIEAKSIKAHKNNKLYFSQHFSENQEAHQVERISDFIKNSGRKGYLCLELKRGRGKKRQGVFLPWHFIDFAYNKDEVGLTLEEIKEKGYKMKREGSEYVLTEDMKGYLKAAAGEVK